jgi:uroporphyrinogen-III synthase
LAPETVVLTRSEQDNSSLGKMLTALGVTVVSYPCTHINFSALHQLQLPGHTDLTDYDVLAFTSRNGVRGSVSLLEHSKESTALLAAVGPGTAKEIHQIIGRWPDIVSPRQTGVDLAREIIAFMTHHTCASKQTHTEHKKIRGTTVLHLRGAFVNPDFKRILTDSNVYVEELVVYENTEPDYPDISLTGREIVVLTSPLAAKRFAGQHGTLFTAVAIGPVTRKYLKEHGFERVYMSDDSTNSALVRCVQKVIQKNR